VICDAVWADAAVETATRARPAITLVRIDERRPDPSATVVARILTA
jgi:hypothetical protein